MQGALVDHVEAGFVTMDQREGGGLGQGLEGEGNTAQGVGGGIGLGGRGAEHVGLDGPGAACAPAGGDHLLDYAEFEAVGGLETIGVLRHEGPKRLGRLVIKDQAAGQKAVAPGILGGTELADGGTGTFCAEAVGTGGGDSSW